MTETPLGGALVIERRQIADDRGSLCRLYAEDELSQLGFENGIVQINHTVTKKLGAVRGLHFQFPPHAETKLVMCIRGRVFDVAVDLRSGSPTFLKWHGEELSAENNRALLVPKGFAHGFQTLTKDAELIYLHSADYVPSAEGGLNVNDPSLAISWRLPVAELSQRDQDHTMLDDSFKGIDL